MNSFRNILMAAVAICFLNNGLQAAANVPLAEMQQQQQQQQQQQHEHGHHFKKIQIIKDIKAYILQNPHLQLQRLNKNAPNDHRTQSVKYTLGSRIAGDSMVAQYADTFYYPTARDVSVQVSYPDNGLGSVVTAVDINCLQDNGDGNAYVVAGGIGQRFISVVLEAPQTTRFTYNVHVFGKN